MLGMTAFGHSRHEAAALGSLFHWMLMSCFAAFLPFASHPGTTSYGRKGEYSLPSVNSRLCCNQVISPPDENVLFGENRT